MDTERNLLFGVVAFQSGAVDAEGLAETCAAWSSEQTLPLADIMVDRGLMTVEQKSEVQRAVEQELASHGGDPHATLAATIDGRSLEAIGEVAGSQGVLDVGPASPPAVGQGGHVVLGSLSQNEIDARERYTLTHLHAKGGMGRVWLARDGSLGRQIALKELRPDQSDNTIVCSRFLYEAKITAQLEHPGIVPVYELGEGDAPYYTMRFVRGRTLSEAIRAYHKKRAAGEADSVELNDLLLAFVGVCNAVAYAHSRGIIHRDLKGQNVVLGDFGEHIVLDWGLAKRVGPDPSPAPAQEPGAAEDAVPADQLVPEAGTAVTCAAAGIDENLTLPEDNDGATTPGSVPGGADLLASGSGSGSGLGLGSGHGSNGHPGSNGSAHHAGGSRSARHGLPESGAGPEGTMQGQLLGTPAYMAPEQAQARHDLVDQRTDIYGLGAILYEILTGRPPFVAPKTSEVIRKVLQEEATPPRQIVPEIAPGLEAVCLKAIRKEKADRYQSASELAQEVRRHLADEPVKAFAEPWILRAQRWMRRNKVKVAASAALVVTATIALGVSTFVISGERNEAEAQGQQAREAVHLLVEGDDIGFDDPLDAVQKEKLEKALAYYEKFTSRAAGNRALQLEHGQARQQMGDLQRKLGRLGDSEFAYRKAIELLMPLTGDAGVGREARRKLSRTRTLLGDLLVRRGADKGQADELYRKAAEAQRVLADPKQDPAAGAEDILRLGQTVKSQAELMRLNGKFAQARPVYDESVALLVRAHAAAPDHAEIRNELAAAIEARGWIHRELGDIAKAEADYRRSLELLEKLVAESPTISRHREALAKACNSLGIIEQESGRLDEAEAHLRREIPLAERLVQDFPDRPEYHRIQARALTVFGGVLRLRGQFAEAEPVLRRAIDLDTAILDKSSGDVLVRFQLAMAHHNLGSILSQQGNHVAAIAAIRKSQAINEALAREFPDKPSYSSDLAANLDILALALNDAGQPGAQENFRAANAIYERLIAAHPEQAEYRVWQANCLRNEGNILAESKPDEAEAVLRKALARLEPGDSKPLSAEAMRIQATIYSNLGRMHRAGAEDALRRSITISEKVLSSKTGTLTDRYNLAVAQNNLADFLSPDQRPALAIAEGEVVPPNVIAPGRIPEAGPYFAQSVASFEKLVAEAPRSWEYQYVFGIVLDGQAAWLDRTGKPADARVVMASAVAHERQAAVLSNNAPVCHIALAKYLIRLADINCKLGSYDEAARLALEATRAVPSDNRPHACYDASRTLARVIAQSDADSKLHAADRERLARTYLTRTVVLLREAIDASPKLAEQIAGDPDIKVLRARPQFQTIMNTLVDLGK